MGAAPHPDLLSSFGVFRRPGGMAADLGDVRLLTRQSLGSDNWHRRHAGSLCRRPTKRGWSLVRAAHRSFTGVGLAMAATRRVIEWALALSILLSASRTDVIVADDAEVAVTPWVSPLEDLRLTDPYDQILIMVIEHSSIREAQ